MPNAKKAPNIKPRSVFDDQLWDSAKQATTIRQSYTQSTTVTTVEDDGAQSRVDVVAASNTALSGLLTIDGVTLVAGDRVLVANNTTASEGGVYVAASGAWSRSDDSLPAGMLVSVLDGTTYGGTLWQLDATDDPDVGTDDIAFVQVGGVGGSGTTNTVARWTGTSTLGDSIITDDGSNVSIGTGASTTGLVTIRRDGAANAALYVSNETATGTGAAIFGYTTLSSGAGVEGYGTGASSKGVYGRGDYGVYGETATGSAAVAGIPTGDATAIYAERNVAGAASPMVQVWQKDSTTTGDLIQATQDGSGTCIYAVASTGRALYAYRTNGSATTEVVYVHQDAAADSSDALYVQNDGTAAGSDAVRAVATGGVGVRAQSTTAHSAYIYRNSSTATTPTMTVYQDHASDSERVLEVNGDGTGDLLYVTNGASYRFYVTDSGQSYFNANGDGDALTIYTNNTDATKGSLRLQVDGSYGANYFDTCSGGHANHAPQVIFRRGRGTVSSPSTTQSGDQLGGFYFRGHNGTDYQQRAGFASFLDGAVSGSTVPANLIFYTGTTSLSERMRLSSAGDLGLGVTSPGAKADIQASNATHALRVNQQSTGNIATFQDNATTCVEILDGGNLYTQKGRRAGVRTLTTSPTTLAATDEVVLVDTSAVTHTITLPAVAAGRRITIKDSGNNAATRNITVNRGGTSLIDGATSQTINTNYGRLDLVSNGTNWFILT